MPSINIFLQFVCFGGSPSRMKKFAFFMVDELKVKLSAGHTLCDISGGSDRYVLYKAGPVISVSVSTCMFRCLQNINYNVSVYMHIGKPLYKSCDKVQYDTMFIEHYVPSL